MRKLGTTTINMPYTYRAWFGLNNNQLLNLALFLAGKIGEDAKGFTYHNIDETDNKPTVSIDYLSYTKLFSANAVQQAVEPNTHPFIFTPVDEMPDDIVNYVFYMNNGTNTTALGVEKWEDDEGTGGIFYCCQPLEYSFTFKVIGLRENGDIYESDVTDANGNYKFIVHVGDHDDEENPRGYIYGEAQLTKETSVKVGASAKIYNNRDNALNFLESGIDEGGLNNEDEPEGGSERDTEELYFNCRIYRSQFTHRNPSEFVEDTNIRFKIKAYDSETGKMIPNANRGVIGWVDDSGADGYKNVRFIYNTTTKNVIECYVDGVTVPLNDFNFNSFYGTYTDNFKYGNYYYYGKVNTNMYIFDSLHNAQQFLDGLNDGLNGLITGGQVGDLTNMTLTNNDVNYNVGMSETYILTQTQVSQLADRFNMNVTDNGNILDGLFMGLSMYNNPIDVCIDLFALPVNVTDFVETSSHSIDFNPKKRTTE